MYFVINATDRQAILDRFDYLIARCDASPAELRDISTGISDRAELHALLREHLNLRYDTMFVELGIWSIICSGASLTSPSFPLRGVRLALELSLSDLGSAS